MFGMLFADVFDAEIIDCETKGNGSGAMSEESMGVLILDIAVAV